MKFKIGDKVIVQGPHAKLNGGSPLEVVDWCASTDCYLVEYGDSSSCWAHVSQMTLAEPEPKYKVGDRVSFALPGYTMSGQVIGYSKGLALPYKVRLTLYLKDDELSPAATGSCLNHSVFG